MAATNEFTYPYNPNGVLDECKITGEAHTITPGTSNNYNWFIPNAAPFFGFSVVLKHVASGRTLQRGVDYNLGLEYHQFNTQVTLRPVYAAIILIDTSLTGQFTLDYMTIGGQYAINQNKALEYMVNAAIDPRVTQWDSVTDIPPQFPVTSHLHDAADIIGMADVVTAIQALTAAMLSGGGKWFQSLNEHLNDFNDPHHVLDMIPGDGGSAIPKATQQQAIEGTDNTGYMTALRTAQYCAANILTVIEAHINNKNNPHGVDKSAVGLALVQNLALATKTDVDGNTNTGNYATLEVAMYAAQLAVQAYQTTYNQSLATQQEAETGANNSHWMSPLRVAQFVAAGVGKALQQHIDATGNVHSLTAADLNLDNLPNFRATTASDVTNQANFDDTLTTPEIVNLLIQKALDDIGAGDGLTIDDVKTYVNSILGKVPNWAGADYSDVQNPTATDKIMSPSLTKAMTDAYGGIVLLGLCFTDSQVSAYKAQSARQEVLVDVTNNQVWEYDGDAAAWVQTAGAVVADYLTDAVTYFNVVSKQGYKCMDHTVPSFVPVIEAPRVTVSNSAPPTDTAGYNEGHVWYQVS